MKKNTKGIVLLVLASILFLASVYLFFHNKINPGYSLVAYFQATMENHNEVNDIIHYKEDSIDKYKIDSGLKIKEKMYSIKMSTSFSLYFVTPSFDYEYCYGYNLFLGKDHTSFMIRKETTLESKRTAYHIYHISKDDGDTLSEMADKLEYYPID